MSTDPDMSSDCRSRVKAWLSLVGGLALLISLFFGAFLLIVLPIEMWQKRQAESWPARDAVVTTSYARKLHSSRSGTRWAPEICVTYRDDQTTSCIRRVRYGGVRFGKAKRETEEAVARYPIGRRVAVHHRPGDSKDTVLEARSSWLEMRIAMAVGLAMVGLPLLGILIARRRSLARR